MFWNIWHTPHASQRVKPAYVFSLSDDRTHLQPFATHKWPDHVYFPRESGGKPLVTKEWASNIFNNGAPKLAKWLFLHIFSFYDQSKHQVFSATYFDLGPCPTWLGPAGIWQLIGRPGHLVCGRRNFKVRALHSQRLHKMWQNCWRPMLVSKKMLGLIFALGILARGILQP